MDDGIKQRLIGAVLLVALMVIFLPMLFSDRDVETVDILIEMPDKPAIPEFDISKPVKPSEKRRGEQEPSEKQTGQQDPVVLSPSEQSEPEKPLTQNPVQNPVPIKPDAPTVSELETQQQQQARQTLQELSDKKVDANNLPVSWVLQVASFKERSNAEKLRDKLRKGGYKAYIKFSHDIEPKMIRVLVGPVLERKTIDGIKISISKQYQLDGFIVRYLP